MYSESSETGSQLMEDFALPAGPYLALGEEVDLEVVVRDYREDSTSVYATPNRWSGRRVLNPPSAYWTATPQSGSA
jgi:hypothetical protein